MHAYRIKHDASGKSYFEEGTLPEYFDLNAERFFLMTAIEDYQRLQHRAPRYQYVVTLKGKLRFTTSDGKSFLIEPGIILVAEDTEGEGHSWELTEGTEWHRIYIVPHPEAQDGFIANTTF